MTLLFTIISFIVALGVLITFHEFGHYLVARWNDVKVLRFSIGFGQPIFRKKLGKDQTEWVVAAIPLGGYVKMLDENEGEVPQEDLPRAFNRQAVARRFAIVAAGPIANFLLAIILYWLIFILGINGIKPILGPVQSETPAAHAQLETGETITYIDGEPMPSWQDVRWTLLQKVLDQSPNVQIETIAQNGTISHRKLDLSSIHADELDGDFLGKIGLNGYQPIIAPIIAQIIPDSVSEHAGLLVNDEIIAINNKEVTDWIALVQEIRSNPGQRLTLDILRNQEVLQFDITPDTVTERGETIGKLGIAPKIDQSELEKLQVTVNYPPLTALQKALDKTWETTALTFKMLGKMVTGDVSWKNISGPISIADYAGQSAQMGLVSYLAFLALISVSLGVLNLLPIPILDGGHLMYYVIEIIKGAPLSDKAILIGQKIGMAMLFTLMIFAIYNDINRLISS